MAKKKSASVEPEEERGTSTVSLRLDNLLLAWIDAQAEAENRTRANMIDTLLKQERARRGDQLGNLVTKREEQLETHPIVEGRKFR